MVEEAEVHPEKSRARQAVALRIQRAIREWAQAVTRLGAEVKGLWLVDFDFGQGCYCWKHPEESLEYWHDYESGFAGRKLITPSVLH